MSKQITWHKIADFEAELSFSSNNIAVATAAGKNICIGKFRDRLFAFAFKCPHAGGFLSDGHIDAMGQVVCPLHRYKFDPSNGRNTSGEGYYLKHGPVEIRDEAIYVGMESGGFFSWL